MRSLQAITALAFLVFAALTISARPDAPQPVQVISVAPATPDTTTTTLPPPETLPPGLAASLARALAPGEPTIEPNDWLNVEPYEPIPLDADPATLQEYVATQALFTYGWQGTEWDSLEWLLFKESSWEADANNPASTARYLFQFLASTSRNYGIDHRDLNGRDPSVEDQVEAGLRYIADRYRTPSGAQRAWLRNCSSIYGCYY